MRFTPTALPGVLIIEPDVFRDPRGFFLETFQAERYAAAGIDGRFVQDNHSRSTRGTLRGLHAQLQRPQAKLVRAISGEIYDVVVDLRRGGPTYRQWAAVRLSADNFLQIYVPAGFAHGFCVLSEVAEIEYKCTDYYDPASELRLLWNDPAIGIEWPLSEPLLSEKDRLGQRLEAIEHLLPHYVAS